MRYLSTYQTMMGLIDEMKGGQKRFGPGYFDLIFSQMIGKNSFGSFRAPSSGS